MGAGLSVMDAKQLIDIILDVRTFEEWCEGHHPRAIHLPLDKVEKNFINFI
jgi:rhodanese-related sulfurtransferase